MTKALMKKQMMEVFSWLYQDKKSGKLRNTKGIAMYAILYLVLFGFLGVIFGVTADALCEPLLEMDMGWLYWYLMGIVALLLGVFGSVFNTYSSLYQAKDNDILFSMPIPPSRIMLVRLSGVYAMGLMYELIVMVPTVIIWLVNAPFNLVGTINILLIPFVLSLLVLVLSAVLGWVVALVTTKVKHKNLITVVLSLAFMGAYFYVCGHMYSILENILANLALIGQNLHSQLSPLYHMGAAAEGSVLSMLIFTGMMGVLALLTYGVLSRSFIKLATTNRSAAGRKSRSNSSRSNSARLAKSVSPSSALLRKEFLRFTGSANYMLNCGLGIIMLPISAILLVWKAGDIRPLFAYIPEETLALIAIAAICTMVSMNDMAAPSISLEGRNLWIIQSLPVSGRQVLMAKLKMHAILTIIPAVAPVLAIEWLVQPKPIYAVALPVVVILFVILMASIGLICNLKMPNLQWSSEIIPIKQSAPVMIALFGGWLIVAALAGIYFLVSGYMGGMSFIICLIVLMFAADCCLLHWLMNKGAAVLDSL